MDARIARAEQLHAEAGQLDMLAHRVIGKAELEALASGAAALRRDAADNERAARLRQQLSLRGRDL